MTNDTKTIIDKIARVPVNGATDKVWIKIRIRKARK